MSPSYDSQQLHVKDIEDRKKSNQGNYFKAIEINGHHLLRLEKDSAQFVRVEDDFKEQINLSGT